MTTAQAVRAVSRDAAEWCGLDWQAINRNVRHVVSKRTCVRVDHEIFSSLWRWARRRHHHRGTATGVWSLGGRHNSSNRVRGLSADTRVLEQGWLERGLGVAPATPPVEGR